jgi:hypothetical protein
MDTDAFNTCIDDESTGRMLDMTEKPGPSALRARPRPPGPTLKCAPPSLPSRGRPG